MSGAAELATAEAAPKLPAAYAPFLPVLEQFSEPMLRILHGQLARLESLARILETPELAEQGEFEGLGGLTLRGDLAQIVQSELLLRTEEPLEFLRRLAESETLFHEKRYADPGVRPVYRVMISVGPGSLGHGRLVALAALFFLARVARARGAALHWCFLPGADGIVWFEGLARESVGRLLRVAAFREMSPEDAEAAAELWAALAKEAARPGARAPNPTDWTVGGRQDGAAVSRLDGALSFRLGPPSPGAPRTAEVSLRQKGRERSRAQVAFPDDRICVSALNDPFRPLSPSQAAGLPARRGELIGWEPRYFTSADSLTRIVRVDDGLLILPFGQKLTLDRVWFVPLSAQAVLAGVLLHSYNFVSVLIRRAGGGGDTLAYGRLPLAYNHPNPPTIRTATVATEHLFGKQRPYSAPPLSDRGNPVFYSASGHPFAVDPYSDAQRLGFEPLYKQPKILGVSGPYSIFRETAEGGAVLKVRKPGGGHADAFREGEAPVELNRLYGLVYSRSEHSLAYSLAPGHWTVPARSAVQGGEEEGRKLALGEGETVLSVRSRPHDLIARLWSDVRAGGTGAVRTVRRNPDGAWVQSRPNLLLGDDAARIVKLELSSEGVWAMAVDEAGSPAELLVFRLDKNGKTRSLRFDLQALRQRATIIDTDALHG